MGNQLITIILNGVLSILGALASYAVTVGIAYLKKKKESLVKQIGVEQYNKCYNIAKDVYYIVEQQFKFIPQAGEQKKKEFDNLLIKKIPGISQEEINHFREAICGKINTELKDSKLAAPVFNSETDSADAQNIIQQDAQTTEPTES
jgi:hypothetical protein